ncbi:hypothetical protein Tco_0455346 [Tanacetum coccineum]
MTSWIHKDGDGDALFQLKSDSLPHAHAQTTKTFYKHQDSRIMKAQELKTKTSAFQDDAKYEHVGQDTRSQGGKDDQDKQGKDLKISDIKTKSKDNDKGSRSKITKHEGTSLQRIQRPRPQDLNDKSNLIDLMKECHNELTSGEIVSLKIMSRTMEVLHLLPVAFTVLKTQFEKIFSSVRIKPSSLDGMYARKDFLAYTSMEPQLFKEIILKNFDFIEDYMLKTIIHAQMIQKRLDDKKLQIQECTVQEVKALDAISEDKAKQSCMESFRKLHSHLKHLSYNNLKGTRIESGFKRAFATLFGQDVETFIANKATGPSDSNKEQDTSRDQE